MSLLHKLRQEAVEALKLMGIEAAALEVDMLLEAVTGQPRSWLITHLDSEITPPQQASFAGLLQRRLQHEPIAYILGERDFYGRRFNVVPGVLIPRPDTETVIAAVQQLYPKGQGLKQFAEVGVGSGAIAVTLLAEFPETTAIATDVSAVALDCATSNAEAHRVKSRLDLRQTSLLTDVSGPFDLVVSNPPYIPTDDIAGLDKTVVSFEPHLALDGGADGLVLYRQLIPQAYDVLKPDGWCVLEHGFNQAEAITAIFAAAGFKGMVSFKDLGGHHRVTVAQKG